MFHCKKIRYDVIKIMVLMVFYTIILNTLCGYTIMHVYMHFSLLDLQCGLSQVQRPTSLYGLRINLTLAPPPPFSSAVDISSLDQGSSLSSFCY
ncbi:hypothetical protein L1887_32811 [Cichorium endivia]|nr:hypothetical protein L1887_32811 [Cichorium endivia]